MRPIETRSDDGRWVDLGLLPEQPSDDGAEDLARRTPAVIEARPGVHAPASSVQAGAVRRVASASASLAGPFRVRCGKPVATGGKTPMFGRAG